MARYNIARDGATPPPTAVYRGILDHRTPDGSLAVGWVAPGLPRHGLGQAHIPDGSTLFLVHYHAMPRGSAYPSGAECFGHWRQRTGCV